MLIAGRLIPKHTLLIGGGQLPSVPAILSGNPARLYWRRRRTYRKRKIGHSGEGIRPGTRLDVSGPLYEAKDQCSFVQ
jgi:hypothetical protein